MNDTATTLPRASWAQVTFFQVYKEFAGVSPETAFVFNNGRQQCRIVVVFTANDANGNPVTLTEADIAQHVRLIQYESGAPIEDAQGTWSASLKKNDYLWDENILLTLAGAGAAPPTPVAPQAGIHTQSIQFFVSTTVSNASTIAAQVSFPNGAPPATTNHRDVEFNKPGGDGVGQFHSAVIVRPVSVDTAGVEYGDTANGLLVPYNVGKNNYSYHVIEHLIKVRIRGAAVPLRSVSAAQAGETLASIYKYGGVFDDEQWGLTYYGQPNATQPDFPANSPAYVDVYTRGHDRAMRGTEMSQNATGLAYRAIDAIEHITLSAFNQGNDGAAASRAAGQPPPERAASFTPKGMFDDCIGKIQNAGSTQVVVGLIVGGLRAQFKNKDKDPLPENTQTILNILDAYGNDHVLTLGFDGSRADQLTIAPARRVAAEDPENPDDWVISHAQIVVEHPQVYANGRQQARIHINIEAKHLGVTVPLSAYEKASIRLIRYDKQDETIPWKDEETHGGWAAQTTYRGYEFQASGAGRVPRDESRAGDIFEFYLSAGMGEAGIRRMIAFEIKGDNGSTYRSTGRCRTADGNDQYFAHMDLGDIHTVAALPIPVYPPSDFQLNGIRQLNPIDHQEVTLSIFHLGRPVSIRRIECEPAGMINWRMNAGNSPCFTGYANPGDTVYRWNTAVPTGLMPKPTPAHPLTQSVIVLCARNDIPREDHMDPPAGPLSVDVMDGAGNSQRCRIGFTPETRDQLTIS